MTTSHFPRVPHTEPMAVLMDLGRGAEGMPPVLEILGPLDTAHLDAALDDLGRSGCGGPAWRPELGRSGPGRHLLRFTARSAEARADLPVGRLADLLTRPSAAQLLAVSGVPATPLQRHLLADDDARPRGDRHVERIAFDWHGPFDQAVFTTAWRSVFARETVLRTAFDDGARPMAVVQGAVEPQITVLDAAGTDWRHLLVRDRARGMDPRRPGPLRITVLRAPGGPARVLLTFHHALLDGWSVRLLLREFYRAYLAGGALPGGERRPDMRDYADWLAGQDTAPAREFFTRDAAHGPLPDLTRLRTFRPVGAGRSGHFRLRLNHEETTNVLTRAAAWGSTEATVLQAVWALLLYRDAEADGPARVRFDTAVAGRGILLDGVERLPGPLRTALPVSVVVDPRDELSGLLAALRERALDLSLYEWVSPGQIAAWSAGERSGADTVLAFETNGRSLAGVVGDLAAAGVHVGVPETLDRASAHPVTLVAHHDGSGRLVLTLHHDGSRIGDAAELLARATLLLRELTTGPERVVRVAEALALLPPSGAVAPPRSRASGTSAGRPRGSAPASGSADAEPCVLRPGAYRGADNVGLLQARDVDRSYYQRLARAYPGPEEIVLLRAPCGEPGGLRVLGAFSGDGVTVHDIARRVAAGGGPPPVVVLTGPATGARDFARILADARRRPGRQPA
ncbi:condensation domain-containing protein [Streptomyces sp. NPDC047315]|uniref:condensation domain-containing protein n=1 Tax=Streptomyces sp. NPDC047315 TaxID=3155142 RepID=UPI0033D74C9F